MVTQVYENAINVAMDVEYRFAINSNSAFSDLKVEIGDKVTKIFNHII
jgi:uncharacterized ferritin-like protein (DUF455 family)